MTLNKKPERSIPYVLPAVSLLICIKSIIALAVFFRPDPSFFVYAWAVLPPVLFLVSFYFLFRGKAGSIYLLALDIFLSLLFIADIIYERGFGHLLNVYMMFATDNMNDLGESAFALMRWTDYLLLLDIPILLFMFGKKVNAPEKRRPAIFLIAAVSSLAFMIFYFGSLGKSRKLDDIEKQPLLISPIGFHMYDVYQLVHEQLDTFDEKEFKEVKSWHEANEKFLDPDPRFAEFEGLLKGKNIIAIQYESLENFLIGREFFGQEVTPNINRLLESSVCFNNIMEQVRDGNSSDAEFLFNTGMYPVSRGSTFFRYGKNAYASLPSLLKDLGYTSAAIHGDDRVYWNRDEAFPAIGFDLYIDQDQFTDTFGIGMGIADESLFEQSFTEIQKLKQPFYFFIITLTSHMPFRLPEDVCFLDVTEQSVYADYLQSIHYTDRMFGSFYDTLKAEGYLENSVLIIYGDHEGIHRYFGTKGALPGNDSRIPFIIHIPGMEGFVSNKVGGQVDMMPTLAYLLGIECDRYAPFVMGRNLFGKYSGSGINKNGEISADSDGTELLREVQRIADMSIRGNYFEQTAIKK